MLSKNVFLSSYFYCFHFVSQNRLAKNDRAAFGRPKTRWRRLSAAATVVFSHSPFAAVDSVKQRETSKKKYLNTRCLVKIMFQSRLNETEDPNSNKLPFSSSIHQGQLSNS